MEHRFPGKWVIWDDDPTGTQTVSGVHVILRPTRSAFRRFLRSEQRSVYILTNTRAMQQHDAVSYLVELKKALEEEAHLAGCRVRHILRGDSTLRGHVFAEIEAFGGPRPVALFVPAFPECGRVTIDGTHYIVQDGHQVPVSETEFAKDTVFGYTSRTMVEWVKEKGEGWRARLVPLSAIRSRGSAAVRDALLGAPPRTIVIPDAETVDDIRTIAAGLSESESTGVEAVVRCASTFAAVRCGLEGRLLQGLPGDEPGRLLVVCGSHTLASTRQLEQLRPVAAPVMIPTAKVFAEGPDSVVSETAARLQERLNDAGIAVLASERIRSLAHSELSDGEQVMKALTATVREVADWCDAVVTKGGITSAQVAADGLQAESAEVCGQLEAGIALWRLQRPNNSRMWHAVIPGNVGDDGTIVRIVGKMKASLINR